VRLLLDTHVLLWWLIDDDRLAAAAKAAIAEQTNIVHYSPATIWEVSIKVTLGRLDLSGADILAETRESGFVELPVTGEHAWRAGSLPTHHRDPFDRMLVAQAEIEQLILVTADKALDAYGIPIPGL